MDLEDAWNRPDEVFFSSSACHVLASAFLARYPNEGFLPLFIRSKAGFRKAGFGGGHIVAVEGEWLFDAGGNQSRPEFIDRYFAHFRSLFPGWDADLIELKGDPAGWEFCKAHNHRHPSQFFRDPTPRANRYLEQFVGPS
jgi:hypothetical protein